MDEFSELTASNLKVQTKRAKDELLVKESEAIRTNVAHFYTTHKELFEIACSEGKDYIKIKGFPPGYRAITDDLRQRGFIVTCSDETDREQFMNISWRY